MTDLELKWKSFIDGHKKSADSKGTVGKPGIAIENRRKELINELIAAGILSKDGYTQQNEKGEFYKV